MISPDLKNDALLTPVLEPLEPKDNSKLLQTKVFRKIEQIPPEEWSQIFPRVLENYYFFKSLDESNFEQFSFYYILVYAQKTLIGATSCFMMNYPLDTTVSGPLKYIFLAIKKIFPNIFNLKVLICGLPMGQGRIGIKEESGKVVKTIQDCMEQIAKHEKAAIVAYKDFDLSYTDMLAPLLEEGFYKFESLPSTEMEIRFNSFDQYLKTLSRASRDGLKRKFKKVDGLIKTGLEITNDLTARAVDEVYELYLQTVRKSENQFEVVPKKFFKNASLNMPHQSKYFLWRIEGKLAAFAFCLVSEDRFIDYYLGFDYSIAYQYHLYFIRFRDLMNWCIANNIKTYEMGNTGYEPKRRLGFELVPLYAYVKHLNQWINPFFKILCKLLKPENFEKVFRDMKRKKP